MEIATQNQSQNNHTEGQLHQPGELYRETFNEVLTGLLYALKLHGGKIDLVTLNDIMEGSSINPVTLEQYYRSTRAIVHEVLSDLQAIIHTVATQCTNYKPTELFQVLLLCLKQYPLHLKVVLITDNQNFWEKHLKPILKQLTNDWPEIDEATWNEVFAVFCSQFHMVLSRWSESDYSDEDLSLAVRRVTAWLSADERYVTQINST